MPYLAKAFALLSIKRWCVTLGFGCLAWPSLFRSPPIEHLTLDVCRPPLLHFLLHLPSGLYTFTYIYTYPLVFIYSCLASAWQGPKNTLMLGARDLTALLWPVRYLLNGKLGREKSLSSAFSSCWLPLVPVCSGGPLVSSQCF